MSPRSRRLLREIGQHSPAPESPAVFGVEEHSPSSPAMPGVEEHSPIEKPVTLEVGKVKIGTQLTIGLRGAQAKLFPQTISGDVVSAFVLNTYDDGICFVRALVKGVQASLVVQPENIIHCCEEKAIALPNFQPQVSKEVPVELAEQPKLEAFDVLEEKQQILSEAQDTQPTTGVIRVVCHKAERGSSAAAPGSLSTVTLPAPLHYKKEKLMSATLTHKPGYSYSPSVAAEKIAFAEATVTKGPKIFKKVNTLFLEWGYDLLKCQQELKEEFKNWLRHYHRAGEKEAIEAMAIASFVDRVPQCLDYV